ncbi:MAG: helix-turn-helix domain-containing protein, partial [Weissella cibaria]
IVNQTKLPFETVRNTLFEDYFNTFITRIPREDALPLVTIALDFVDNEALKRRLIQRLQGFLSINIFITDTQITTADLVISNIHLNYEEQQTIVLRHSPTLAELNEIRRTVKEITIAKFERFTGQTISIT